MADDKHVITGPSDVFIPETLSFSQLLLNSLKAGQNEIALINGVTGINTTYKEILDKSIQLAISLKILGVREGDAVCISSENRLEFILTACAAFYIGAVVVPMNSMYKFDEIQHALNLARPKYLFCSALTAINIKQAADKTYHVKEIILYGTEKVIDAVPFDSLLCMANDQDVNSFKPAIVDPYNDTLVIFFSSGTTGLPKGVMLTHRNFLVGSSHRKTNFAASGLCREDSTIFSIAPWSHSYGFVMSMLLLSINFKLVYATKFEPRQYLKILEKYKVTVAMAVPALIVFLAKHQFISEYDLSSLNSVWCGAAPLSKETQYQVTKRLNLKHCSQGYGMTETTLSVLSVKPIEGSHRKNGSVGQIMTGTKVKVVHISTGASLGPYKFGELCFKGPLIMKGYIGDKLSTNNIFDNKGWLHTGDIGYYDNDEYFYIIDRIKELIKYKGYQVPPAELEAVLLQHEGVSDAGVVGLPDESSGELPLAFVVRQPNSDVTEKELVDFVATKVSSAKQLRGGVIFMQQIPRNPSGKILRRELRVILNKKTSSKL